MRAVLLAIRAIDRRSLIEVFQEALTHKIACIIYYLLFYLACSALYIRFENTQPTNSDHAHNRLHRAIRTRVQLATAQGGRLAAKDYYNSR